MRETTLNRSKRGFVRQVGPKGKEIKFYLGHDKTLAQTRLEKILAMWTVIETEAKQGRQEPFWDEESAKIAKAIASGDTPTMERVSPNEAPAWYVERVKAMEDTIGVPVKPGDEFMYQTGREDIQEDIHRLRRALNGKSAATDSKTTGQMLHEAIKAYQEHIRKEYRTGDESITDNGKTKLDQLETIMTYVPDCDLGTLDYHGCDEVFGIFRRRPVSKKYGTPMKRKSCTNYIGELGRFFLWLHTSPVWQWRRPEDFALISRAPRDLDEDVEHESADVPTWTLDQLRVLNEYALPLERVFLLLGLNCAYGADQAGRLLIRHLKLADDEKKNSFIDRIRRKKKVRSLHLLWPQTVEAMRWALERRSTQTCDKDFLLLTDKNLPYWRQSKSGNRIGMIPNMWFRLLDRIRKDKKNEFPRLPFNSLRDTSCSMIRDIAGAETASVHLAHKHQSKDENLGRYSNPVRRRHFKALRKLENKLADVFAAAGPTPFVRQRRNHIGLDRVRKITQLHAEGVPILEIGRRLGVSPGTVYRHLGK